MLKCLVGKSSRRASPLRKIHKGENKDKFDGIIFYYLKIVLANSVAFYDCQGLSFL